MYSLHSHMYILTLTYIYIRGGAEPEYGIRKGTNNVFFTNTYFEQIL